MTEGHRTPGAASACLYRLRENQIKHLSLLIALAPFDTIHPDSNLEVRALLLSTLVLSVSCSSLCSVVIPLEHERQVR
ncbi:hypothetical protein BDV06DRAFT_191041 [Aspergillus oleicola]